MDKGVRGAPRPPYGPTQGTIEALQLLQRQSPARVDESFLRAQGIAPGNEYKVVGALRFLQLIEEDGRPTEKAHLLKTRGGAFTLNLQEIVREAYGDLFREIRPREATQEAVYNFFVARLRLGGEMATKATRFFISLSRWAGLALPEEPPLRRGAGRVAAGAAASPNARSLSTATSPLVRGNASGRARPSRAARTEVASPSPAPPAGRTALPFMLAITPETAQLDEDELVDLFRKIRRAALQSGLEVV